MKTPKGSILQVAAIMALATGFALTTSCKNGGDTNSSTDTVATNTMPAMKADTMKADTVVAPLPKKTKGTGMVVEPVPVPTEKIIEDKDHVYNHAEVAPAFQGGESALDDYVNDNIKYPGQAMDHGIEGKVMVHFIVDEHGNVTNVSTLGEPIGYGLEDEAVRVIGASPKWIPGKVKGKDVKAYVLLPINFTLR